jgi:uncharacterized protein
MAGTPLLAQQQVGLVDAEETPVGLTGFVAFLLIPFGALGLVVLAWVRLVERRPLAAIGLGGVHRARSFLGGLLAGLAMVMKLIATIWIAGGFQFVGVGNPFHSLFSLGSIAILLVCFAVQCLGLIQFAAQDGYDVPLRQHREPPRNAGFSAVCSPGA